MRIRRFERILDRPFAVDLPITMFNQEAKFKLTILRYHTTDEMRRDPKKAFFVTGQKHNDPIYFSNGSSRQFLSRLENHPERRPISSVDQKSGSEEFLVTPNIDDVTYHHRLSCFCRLLYAGWLLHWEFRVGFQVWVLLEDGRFLKRLDNTTLKCKLYCNSRFMTPVTLQAGKASILWFSYGLLRSYDHSTRSLEKVKFGLVCILKAQNALFWQKQQRMSSHVFSHGLFRAKKFIAAHTFWNSFG